MTFQNSKISSAPKFEVIIEDQKVYFSDYPDFPLFEKSIFPVEVWALLDINFDALSESISKNTEKLKEQYEYLEREFETYNTPLERHNMLKDRKENDTKIHAQYEQLIDSTHNVPHSDQDIPDSSLSGLHNFVKYVLSQPNPIDEYYEGRMTILLEALYEQNYNIEPHTGEIINLLTGELIQESQL